MYTPDLETLYLTEEELATAKKEVEKIAFCKWQRAGCPEDGKHDFWGEAQLEWIEYQYVPDRYAREDELCAMEPPPTETARRR